MGLFCRLVFIVVFAFFGTSFCQGIDSRYEISGNPWVTDFVLWWSYARIPIATFVFGTSLLTWLMIYQNRDRFQHISMNENVKGAIKIIYGTQTGLAKYFSEQMKTKLTAHAIDCDVINMKDCEAEEFLPEQCEKGTTCVFIVSTYTDGEPPESAAWFCKYLREASDDFRVQKSMLNSLKYTVFGLGNSVYQSHYNSAAKNLDVWLKKLSAKCIFPVGLGDDNTMRNDDSNVTVDFEKWMNSFLKHFLKGEEAPRTSDTTTETISYKGKGDDGEKEMAVDYESDEGNTDGNSCKSGPKDNDVVDVEDIGTMMSGFDDTQKNGNNMVEQPVQLNSKEMVTPLIKKSLEKQGYKLIGSHSGVKICRWTKSMMRGRGGCYKHTFYGIESHRCMETTPSLACANKCVFCWRHHTNPVGTEWKWKMDPPDMIVNNALNNHYKMIKQCRGIPGVKPERFEEAMNVQHCALSLVGEPIMYPEINTLIDLLHSKSISTFLVTNAQFPDAIKSLKPVTQLYVSVDASTKESLKKIDRPLFQDFWQRFIDSLRALGIKGQRTVYRLTLVKEFNTEEIESYAKLVELGRPGFIEIKGVTYCGESKASSLTMSNVPWHDEVIGFVKEFVKSLPDYEIASEHEHSNCILVAHKRFFVDGRWCTWIDYEKYHKLMKQFTESNGEKVFYDIDYMAPTPEWAVFGDQNRGFDPAETRWMRNKKKYSSGC